MIKGIQFYLNNGTDPYLNLAKEKYLFDTIEEDRCLLYLWQNQNTVVIGKNQNAFSECRTELLREEGGRLARRLSGGGAVFHDLGNLNFTFLCATEHFDVSKHMQVIQTACALAGIKTELSGRNDVLADGRKFSGNAFYHSKGRSYHHGTLMISADTEKMMRYLTPPKAKLEAKGVKSVRSRVVNLSELAKGLTCEDMKGYLLSAFERVYGMTPTAHPPIPEADIRELAAHFGSWEYLYGNPLPFDLSCEGRVDFGNVELRIGVRDGVIHTTQVFTDALDINISEEIQNALVSCPFDLSAIDEALAKRLPISTAHALHTLLAEQIFA